jgi:septum formation topological specificity factor MinE
MLRVLYFNLVGTESKWYVLDYLELKLLPLFINVSKYHTDFILEFFFNDTSIASEEEQRNLILASKTPERKKTTESRVTETKIAQDEKIYPIFFKHVRIDKTELEVSLYWSESSNFVICLNIECQKCYGLPWNI